MAWIILWANGEELQRLELKPRTPVTIGRSPDCDLTARDILLSRTHCRLEPLGNGWRIIDLGSKNGTRIGWQRVQCHVLRDGEWVRMGRTRLTFHVGPFQPAAHRSKPAPDRLVRPADPHEALTGTVTDFVLLDEDESAPAGAAGAPSPQPRPADPASYYGDPVESLLDELASSYWSDQRLAAGSGAVAQLPASIRVSGRARPLPRIVKPVRREIPSRHTEDPRLTLQADVSTGVEVVPVATPTKRRIQVLPLIGGIIAIAAATAIVIMSAWLLTLAP